MSEQTIFKRYELKYIIDHNQLSKVLEGMSGFMTEDEHGRSRIQSLYYDTPDFILARRSLDKPIYKEKLRLRSYGIANEDSTVFAEIKKKFDGIVYKRRVSMDLPSSRVFLPNSFCGTEQAANYLLKNFKKSIKPSTSKEQIVKEIEYFVSSYKGLAPSIMLQYEREAFYANDDHEFRVTFDDNILWRTKDLRMDAGYYGNRLLDKKYILMEVKVGAAMPLWFSHLLTENGIHQTSFSKYGTAYVTNENLQYALPSCTRNVLPGSNLYRFCGAGKAALAM